MKWALAYRDEYPSNRSRYDRIVSTGKFEYVGVTSALGPNLLPSPMRDCKAIPISDAYVATSGAVHEVRISRSQVRL